MKLWMGMCVGFALVFGVGCAPPSAGTWQEALVDYIEMEGAGDPAALRDLSDEHGRILFHTFGTQEGFITKYRTDMDGMLIGAERIGDETWYIFLIAQVRYRGGSYDTSWDYPNVLMMRASAMTAGPDGITWRTGPEDQAATDAYLRPQHEGWNAGHPGDPDAPVTRFPHEWDRFTHSRVGTTVTILDEHSGARWTIDLAAPDG